MKKTGKFEFRPIEDISKVDQLRKEVDLETLAEYAKGSSELLKISVQLPEGYVEGK